VCVFNTIFILKLHIIIIIIICVLAGETPVFRSKTATIDFFNNYNTVESYLLFSAIMVAISAIMFESEQLSSTEQDSLAYLVIAIVAVSLSYFCFVLFTELWIAFFPHIPLFWMKLKEDEDILDHDIEFADFGIARYVNVFFLYYRQFIFY
jgi:lysylphosphatidylglycerol synthetase-like protein (DUF2156 family)